MAFSNQDESDSALYGLHTLSLNRFQSGYKLLMNYIHFRLKL